MTVPEEDKRETSSPWDKSWVFMLAFLCLISLAGLGTWGRIRMLEDDNASLEKKLADEMKVHEVEEAQVNAHLRHKNRLFKTLRHELAVTTHNFQRLNDSVKDVKEHLGDAIKNATAGPSQYLTDCVGITLPPGFEYAPKDQVIFPHDITHDLTGLHSLVKANDQNGFLLSVTTSAENAGLFNRPSFPWSQWTWLSAIIEQPQLSGNFTEWGVGAGGSAMFLGAIASLRGKSTAGFDAWKSSDDAAQHIKQFTDNAQQFGLSIPNNVELFDLKADSIPWPEAGKDERLLFSHIDSDDYETVLGVLQVIYDNTMDGGMFAVDSFFVPNSGSKKAVEDFFSAKAPGQSPLIYPVFPGNSVLIFKGRFANATQDKPNTLDGHYYSFKYIKGRPELFSSVNRSVSQLSEVHKSVKNDPAANATSVCWVSLALNNARNLRDFIQSSEQHVPDFEASDLFRFLSDSSQLAA